ncbi:hypothetical protein BZA70DRAFT_280805 [Myxozyma melibiosi]|uniref:DASH complex subunit DAD2 n=1 Tax=Myxozyma melibiosi TaxID=54550 RepID=A0ABR1F5R1_9ASCO
MHRASISNPQSMSSSGGFHSRASIEPTSMRPRQMSHLHSQLAQLQANLSDLESLLRVTAGSLYVFLFLKREEREGREGANDDDAGLWRQDACLSGMRWRSSSNPSSSSRDRKAVLLIRRRRLLFRV